jgi:hypothetical protein
MFGNNRKVIPKYFLMQYQILLFQIAHFYKLTYKVKIIFYFKNSIAAFTPLS